MTELIDIAAKAFLFFVLFIAAVMIFCICYSVATEIVRQIELKRRARRKLRKKKEDPDGLFQDLFDRY